MVALDKLTGRTDRQTERQILKETMDCGGERWIHTVVKLHLVTW